VNQVDARVQNFEINFLKEAAKFVGDFKSLTKEADASLAKHKILELDIKRLLKTVVSDQKDITKDLSKNTKFAKQPNVEILSKIGETNALSKPVTSNSVSTPQVSKGVNNDKVIAPGMFRISPDKVSREAKKVPNTVRLDNTKTRRPQPRSNTKNDRVPSASKSSQSMNKDVKVEEHYRNLLLSKKNKHSSSACNKSKIESQDVISKSCLCYVWSPTGKMFDQDGKLLVPINSESHIDCSNGDNACTSNAMEPKIKRFTNSTSLLGRLSRFVCGASIQVVQST
nr:hypothetical protein [Tanacetum cinerariifolium]